MKKKVALLGIYHESNTFLPNETLWEDFQNGHLLYGEDIRSEYENAHHEIGGIIEVFDQSDVEIVPLFFAEATPGGTIIEATFNRLIEEIISALKDEKIGRASCRERVEITGGGEIQQRRRAEKR